MKQQSTKKNQGNKELVQDKKTNQSPDPSPEKSEKIDCNIVIDAERAALKNRRYLLFGAPAATEFDETSFGIAMSGGGIRSATINLGFLSTLNRFGLLKRADYLSTVSGGGYAGAYLHATLKGLAHKVQNNGVQQEDPKESQALDRHVQSGNAIQENYYKHLFSPLHVNHMRNRGEYLIPGEGLEKMINRIVLIVGYLSSLVMSLLSPVLLLVAVTCVMLIFSEFVNISTKVFSTYANLALLSGGVAFAFLLTVHYALNSLKIYRLNISLSFHRMETSLLIILISVIFAVLYPATEIQGSNYAINWLLTCLAIGAIAIVLGFFANPNASSFHRFYRAQLSEAFLQFADSYKNVRLKDLFRVNRDHPESNDNPEDYINPYPLINTCLNLQATKDPKFQGTKTNDYFLLSPLYCGAKLTGYVETATHKGYKSMTLPAATTISAAALNPGMGIYSNKLRSVFLTLFNARLGYWTWNPMKKIKRFAMVWWPPYFFYELFSSIGTDKKMLNISDGGHIENLAVYELLRRKCRLIIAVDAGEDSKYEFTDLENLTIRARNELGIEIRFLEGQDPEDIIRPKASFGYSRKRFAVAGLYIIWEEFNVEDENGALVQKKDKNGKDEAIKMLVNYSYLTEEMYQAFEKGKKQEADSIPIYVKDEKGYIKLKVQIKDAPEKDEMGKAELASYAHWLELAAKQMEAKFNDEAGNRTGLEKLRIGTLVYVKSSVTAPEGKPNIAPPKEEKAPGFLKRLVMQFQESPVKDPKSLRYAVYKYKIYHPTFPHEPTSDQFFDEVQWQAYYQLGQYLGDDMLNDLVAKQTSKDGKTDISLNDLIGYFAQPTAVPPAPTEREVETAELTARGIEEALPEAAEHVEPLIQKEDEYYKI